MHPKRTILRDLRNDPGVAARFWSKVVRPATSDCWLWNGANDGGSGYGSFMLDGLGQKAHRIAWELTRGPIPDGLRVLHRCDNPPCVRPNHLYVGTMSDNMKEMWNKGRHSTPGRRKGEASHLSKLTAEQVIRIRALARQGLTQQAIATQFGVTQTNVGQIVSRKIWAHI